MKRKMILNDLKKNMAVNIILLIFIIMSAFLMSSGTMVIFRLADSMDEIFDTAKPPHFLQMHSGKIDQSRIDEFSKDFTYIRSQQTVNMLNINTGNIFYQKHEETDEYISMTDNMMDNGFTVQNSDFDFLLDMNNTIAGVNDGEVEVPVSYMNMYGLDIDDKLIIRDGNFVRSYRISTFIRDAQMASSMASSTRFLVSPNDFADLAEATGDMEYIIEYRFSDEKYASEFKNAYTANDSGMFVNGPAITYPLIKMLNGISGGLLAGLLVLVSFILIAVAVINVKYTVMAAVEDEQKEIGAMKAIGFSGKNIHDLYLGKYKALSVIGCVTGYFTGFAVNGKLTENIVEAFGESSLNLFEQILPLISTAIVYLIVIISCRKVLKKTDRITVAEALLYEKNNGQTSCSYSMPLWKTSGRNINTTYALRECLTQKKRWITVAAVFFLSSVIMAVPVNLLNTFKSPEFSESIGSAKCDIRMGIQFTDNMSGKRKAVESSLDSIGEVLQYSTYASVNYETDGDDGKEPFVIECGDYTKFPVKCIDGKAPETYGEIAVSYLNSKKFGLKTGDKLNVYLGDIQRELVVCGIYQDITGGGYTAKAQLDYSDKNAAAYTFFVDLTPKITADEFMNRYSDTFDYVKIAPMEEYLKQTFGNLIASFRSVAVVTNIIAVCMAGFMTALFVRLTLIKDKSKCAVLRAIGFTEREISRQYMLQSGLSALTGIITGIVSAVFLGEKLIGVILSVAGVGLAEFRFTVNIWVCAVICPFVLLSTALIITIHCRKSIKMKSISQWLCK